MRYKQLDSHPDFSADSFDNNNMYKAWKMQKDINFDTVISKLKAENSECHLFIKVLPFPKALRMKIKNMPIEIH